MTTICSIKNLSYAIDGNVILNNFSMEIEKNDFIEIRGSNGSGKSTLLKIFCKLIPSKACEYRDNFKEHIDYLGHKNSFNNIKIESKKTSIEVIEQSDVIAGYSSTTLLEALLYGKPIIEPDLTDLEKIGSFNYFDSNANISNRIISKNSLFKLLDSFKKEIKFPDNDLVERSLKSLIYQVDGNSSRRVENKIIQFLGDSKNE